jgi:hypothetical protein
MKQYGFLSAFYKSFYSAALYRDVKERWGFETVAYLLMVLASCWVLTVFNIQGALDRGFAWFSTEILPQLPPITIKNGQVITPKNRPYLIKNLHTKETLILIDTSGQYRTLVQSRSRVLLTKTMLSYVMDAKEGKLRKLPDTLNIHFVPTEFKIMAGHIIQWSWVVLFPLLLALSFIYRLLQVLLYTILGKLLAWVANVPLHCTSILKLTIVSLTPAIVIGTFLKWFDITFQFQWLFYFILAMAYLSFAVRANRKPPGE